jgi:hypothetical protein
VLLHNDGTCIAMNFTDGVVRVLIVTERSAALGDILFHLSTERERVRAIL